MSSAGRSRLTENKIKSKFGSKIAERGLEYFRSRRVLRTVKYGSKFYAEVAGRGAEPYRVEVDLKSLESSCTCPYARMCKHGAAALYYLLENGRESLDAECIFSEFREKYSKDELIKLLESIFAVNPSLFVEILELRGALKSSASAAFALQRFGAVVSGCYDFSAHQQAVGELDFFMRRAIFPLKGEKKAELIMEFLEGVQKYFNDVDDSYGNLGSLVSECAEELSKEFDALEPELQNAIIKKLERWERKDEYGYFDGIADVIKDA